MNSLLNKLQISFSREGRIWKILQKLLSQVIKCFLSDKWFSRCPWYYFQLIQLQNENKNCSFSKSTFILKSAIRKWAVLNRKILIIHQRFIHFFLNYISQIIVENKSNKNLILAAPHLKFGKLILTYTFQCFNGKAK